MMNQIPFVVDTVRRQLRCDGRAADLGASDQILKFLAALASHPTPIRRGDLFADVWGRALRSSHDLGSLYVLVSRVRALLASTAGRTDLLVTTRSGYALHRDVDARLIAEAPPAASSCDHPLAILGHLDRRESIDNRTYRGLRGVSRATGYRELETLVRAGLLVRVGGGRAACYRRAQRGAQVDAGASPETPTSDREAMRARMMHPDPEVRYLARRAFHHARVEPAPQAPALAPDSIEQIFAEADPWLRARLVRGLRRHGEAAVEPARRLLADPDERVRANAIEVLTELGHGLDGKLLQKLARGSDHRTRAAALVALARLTGADVRDAVWRMLGSSAARFRESGRYVVGALAA